KGNSESPGGEGSVTISGDGRRIAWIGTTSRGTDVQLYVRELNSYTIRSVPGSAGAFAPFLSDDGSLLGYFSGHDVRESNLNNGETRGVTSDFASPVGGTYLPTGSILIASESRPLTLIARGGVKQLRVTVPAHS